MLYCVTFRVQWCTQAFRSSKCSHTCVDHKVVSCQAVDLVFVGKRPRVRRVIMTELVIIDVKHFILHECTRTWLQCWIWYTLHCVRWKVKLLRSSIFCCSDTSQCWTPSLIMHCSVPPLPWCHCLFSHGAPVQMGDTVSKLNLHPAWLFLFCKAAKQKATLLVS